MLLQKSNKENAVQAQPFITHDLRVMKKCLDTGRRAVCCGEDAENAMKSLALYWHLNNLAKSFTNLDGAGHEFDLSCLPFRFNVVCKHGQGGSSSFCSIPK